MSDKLKYVRTPEDISKENRDSRDNQTVRFLKYQEAFRFNIGDIVIMQYNYNGHQWNTKTTSGGTDAPVKYMYVFENEVGIGYIKQLRANGKGFTTITICVADLNPLNVRLILDPELVDHLLLGDANEEFDYSRIHAQRTAFRKEATEKNKKLLKDLSTPELRVEWFYSLKKGDKVWMGYDWNSVVNNMQEVTEIFEVPRKEWSHIEKNPIAGTVEGQLIKSYRHVTFKGKNGWERRYAIMDVSTLKVMNSKPWSLKDDSL